MIPNGSRTAENLFNRKKRFLESCAGARYDIMEHGGGHASSTIISPKIFDRFVAPYDSELTRIATRPVSESSTTPAVA